MSPNDPALTCEVSRRKQQLVAAGLGKTRALPCVSAMSCVHPHLISAITRCNSSRSSDAGAFAATLTTQSSNKSSTMTWMTLSCADLTATI